MTLAAARRPAGITPLRIYRGIRQRIGVGRDPRLLDRTLVRIGHADRHEPVFPT